MTKIALIAGTGGLPNTLAASLVAQGRPPVVCEMLGFPSEVEGQFTRVPFRIETLGAFLKDLTALGVRQVCMAGAMQRPAVDPSALDSDTAPMVPRLMAAMAKGDDGTLREVIAIFEESGFEVVGAHQIAPELCPAAGVHTKATPPDLTNDIAAARLALEDMGRHDLGQAVVTSRGAVIAREDQRGTAALINDYCEASEASNDAGDPLTWAIDTVGDALGNAADWLSGGKPQSSTHPVVLFKAPKPDQNMLVDMPLIGPDTAMQAARAGFDGIVVAHNGVMVLDLVQVISILDTQNMFLWVLPSDAP